jgi:hypothetical protein
MRYRLMASYRGASYQAGVGPSDKEVTLFAACPPPEKLGFRSSAGHWRKRVSVDEIDSLWESRPIGRYRGEPCMVLDDLRDRLHIAYLGRDLHTARRLGFWEVDRGVFEIVVPRQEIDDLREERAEYQLAVVEPVDQDPRGTGPWAAAPPDRPDTGSWAADPRDQRGPRDTGSWTAGPRDKGHPPGASPWAAQGAGARDLMDTGPSWAANPRAPRDTGAWSARDANAQDPREVGTWAVRDADPRESGAQPLRGRGGWHVRDTGGWEAPDTGAWDAQEVAALARQEPAGARQEPAGGDPQDPAEMEPSPRQQRAPDAAAVMPAPRQQRALDAAAVWHGSPASDDLRSRSAPVPADAPAATQRLAGPQRPDTQFAAITSIDSIGEPAIAPGSAVTGEHAAMAGRVIGGRRPAGKARVTAQSVFSHLLELASIPQSAYAVDEEIDGAMCLMHADGGYEVFSSAGRARHEVRFFEDEETAYFYLFGILAAEAVRSGHLGPRAVQPPAHRVPGPQPGPPANQPGSGPQSS